MSVAIATMGKFIPAVGSGPGPGGDGGGSTPYAQGGGVYAGAVLPEKKRLKVDVNYLQVNISEQEEPKLTISPIKVSDD